MGALDQFAKATFAIDTARITGGGVVWKGPKEVGLTEVRLDGLLSVQAPDRLAGLPEPWRDAARHADVVLETKMPGDHVPNLAILRAELRRAAWHVRRAEQEGEDWAGSVGLWHVAPHVPDALRRSRTLHPRAEGCYAMDHAGSPSWWIAANELPLDEALIPFLVARSGKALDELARWLVGRRPPEWLLNMLRWLPMSAAAKWEIYDQIRISDPPPELREQWKWLVEQLVQLDPSAGEKVRQQGLQQGREAEARRALRRVLARRGLAVSPAQDARIEACADLATLERWLDQAVTSASAEEALA